MRIRAQSATASSPAIVEPAKALASQLFSRIGVELRWEKRPWAPLTNAGSMEEAVVLEMLICSSTQRGLGRFSAEALGYARPHASSGIQIYIFYDRVVRTQRELVISVLGYVLAHEIAHVLEEECRHSQAGVMKANWQGADYSQMAVRRLLFAPDDVTLIHAGLAKQLARSLTGMTVASIRLPQPIK